RGKKFAKATGANWTNPSGSLADDTSAATYSGPGRDWLALTDPGIDLNSTYQDGASIDWVTVSIKGSGSVEVCLTLDGSTCHGQIRFVGLDGATTQKVIGTGARTETWGENLWTYDMTAQRNKFFVIMLRAAQAGGPV